MKSVENNKYLNAHNSLRRSKLALAVGLSIFGMASTAEDWSSVEKINPAANAAKQLTELLHDQHKTHKKFPSDPYHQVIWNTDGPNTHTLKKTWAVSEKVDDQLTYFQLVQKGDKLSTIKVEPIPSEDVITVVDSPIRPDIQEVGVNKELVASGVVTLKGKNKLPYMEVTTVTDNTINGTVTRETTEVPVGVTSVTGTSGVG